MTPYIFLAGYATLVLLTLVRGPVWGLYLYCFAFYFSPEHTWWENMVPDLRYLMIAVALTIGSMFMHQQFGRRGDKLTSGMKLFIAFVIWMWLVSIWSITGEWQSRGTILFSKHLMIAVLVVLIIQDLESLKRFVLAHLIGAAWMGWHALGKPGRLEGVAGALADANTLGMHFSALLILAALFLLGTRSYYRIGVLLCIPFILNTIILASSRGAFVAMIAGGLVAGWYCPRKLRLQFILAGTLGACLLLYLSHEQFIYRLMTLLSLTETTEESGTGSDRIGIILSQLRMAADHPFGAGYKGTATLSPFYMPEELLTHLGVRGSHNTFMAVLVDLSAIGLSIYLFMYYWLVRRVRNIVSWVRTQTSQEALEFGAIAAGIAGALGVVFVAGLGSNFYHAEIQYWLLAMVAVMLRIIIRMNTQAAKAKQTQEQLGGDQYATR